MQGIFRKENTDKALKYGIYRHLPTYEKIIRNLVSFYTTNTVFQNPFDNSHNLKTTKDNSDYMHGFGIKNIQETASKYGGTLKNDYSNNCFISLVMVSNNE